MYTHKIYRSKKSINYINKVIKLIGFVWHQLVNRQIFPLNASSHGIVLEL